MENRFSEYSINLASLIQHAPSSSPPSSPPSSTSHPPSTSPPPSSPPLMYYPYGTSGFRTLGIKMKSIAYRCAYLLSFVAKHSMGSPTFGLMVTASHNPPNDNGVKIINENGYMIEKRWEKYFEKFANAEFGEFGELLNDVKEVINKSYKNREEDEENREEDEENREEKGVHAVVCCLYTIIEEMIERNEITSNLQGNGRIIVGMDTRSTSNIIKRYIIKGIEASGGIAVDVGEVTTPQLQFLVERANTLQLQDTAINLDIYSQFFEHQLTTFYEIGESTSLIDKAKTVDKEKLGVTSDPTTVMVDGANGIGGKMFPPIGDAVARLSKIRWILKNGGGHPECLNVDCGSEHVERLRKLPSNFEDFKELHRGVSVDGDADRIVYFAYKKHKGASNHLQLEIINGDKIMALFTQMVADLLTNSIMDAELQEGKPLKMGIIQTAYANGNSTQFFSCLINQFSNKRQHISAEVACVKTGVKHLFSKAKEFDLSILFEANGHGTILTKYDALSQWAVDRKIDKKPSYCLLAAFLSIFNQATGDAFTNFMGVEACLSYLRYTMKEWIELYAELPTVQTTLKLSRDKLNQFKTSENETKLLEPKCLQDEIDNALKLSNDKHARAFIRPSGTEDICRIFCEASTNEKAKQLADEIKKLIHLTAK